MINNIEMVYSTSPYTRVPRKNVYFAWLIIYL